MRLAHYILILCLWHGTQTVWCQGNSLKHYTIRNGLPENSIRAIFKDSRGYLWLGSDAGVSKFDGNNFTTYNTKDGLAGESVWSIEEDPNGNMWFGCFGSGLSIYNGKTFNTINLEDSLHNLHIRNLKYCQGSNTIIAGCQNGVIRFNLDGTFTEFNSKKIKVERPILVGGVYEYDKDSIFVACMQYSNYFYIPSQDTLITILEEHRFHKQNAHCLTEKDGKLVTCHGWIRIFEKDSITEWNFSKHNLYGPAWDVVSDNHGNFWAATWGGGSIRPYGHLIRFDDKGYGEDYALKLGIKSEVFWSLFYDPENDILFIGTLDQGLYVMPFSPFENNEILSSYKENHVSLFVDKEDRKILVGEKDLFLLDHDSISKNLFDPKILESAAEAYSRMQYEFNMVFADPEGSFEKYDQLQKKGEFTIKNPYLGVHNDTLAPGSLYKPDLTHIPWSRSKKDWIKKFGYQVESGLNIESVYTINDHVYLMTTYSMIELLEDGEFRIHNIMSGPSFKDQQNRIWGFPQYRRTTLINDIERPLEQIHLDYNKITAPVDVTDACDGPNGQVFFATWTKGFYVYKGGLSFVNYLPENSFFTSNTVRTVDHLKDNYYASTMSNGDIQIFEATDTLTLVKTLDRNSGLHGNSFFDLLFKDGNLYLWHENGIDYASLDQILNNEETHFVFINEKEGYPVYEGSVYDLGKEVWLVHNKGYVKINWENFQNYTQTHTSLIITDLKIQYESIDWNLKELSDKWSNVPSSFSLSYDQNNLEIYFDVINLKNYGKDEFRYKLEGQDDSWSPWRSQQKATYSGLDPGNYIFYVESRNNLKIEKVQQQSISFTIFPPWWKTIWFRFFVIASIIAIIILYIRLRTAQLKKRQKELEHKVDVATVEIRKQKEQIEEAHTEIKDSIIYAQRIQKAILPPDEKFFPNLPDAFVIYKPKDVVAGDFYWMQKVDDTVLFAAADCTGHGVPGAMVSVVCNNALNRTIREFNETDPAKILNQTRDIVIEEFSKTSEEVKDGMDIALCSLEGNKLRFAGAHNPLWIVRNGSSEVEEIKADKQPIGKFAESKPFTSHVIDLNAGDTFYIFSDGFSDQFGGDKGKKYKASNFKNLLLSIQNETMDRQKELLDEAFENWRGKLEQLDDVCVIGVRI